jgi:GntR family transcriptional regulator, transcriptional repressor for pyruvate dehydrogenase complex
MAQLQRFVAFHSKAAPASRRAGGAEGLQPLIRAVRAIAAEGDSLPSERVLAEQLKVKRHQVRRALEALRSNGEIAPARAGRRAMPDERRGDDFVGGTNPLEIIELRLVVEPALARFAALRASPLEIARIGRAASTAANADPGAADLAFHRAVAAGSRNILASELYALLRQVGKDVRIRTGDGDGHATCPNRIRQRDSEHAAIAEAIAARDPERAERAMQEHLAVVQRQILTRLAPGTTAA